MKATRENTVFLTVAAFEDSESKTRAFRKTAEARHVPVIYYDENEKWQGFFHHKIRKMMPRLQEFKERDYRYAFILDSRDIIFIDPVDTILEKFNALNDGKMIFNKDVSGTVWPTHHPLMAQEIEKAMGPDVRLNAGAIAGEIDMILTVQQRVTALRQEFFDGRPRQGIMKKLYALFGKKYVHDDQHLYQICMIYHPELFRIDMRKELFALTRSYPKDVREISYDPDRNNVINTASIIHAPGTSRKDGGDEWVNRALQNWWRNDSANQQKDAMKSETNP
jgi:hypothetical protein